MKISPVTKVSFVSLLLTVVTFAALQIGKPLQIDTNLKDLSPTLTQDKALQVAVSKLSTDIENRFTLLISGTDGVAVSEAANILSDGLSALQGVAAEIDGENTAAALIDSLSPFRFGFITDSQKKILNESSSDELVVRANEKLYQLSDVTRLLPVDQDPFGWFTNYLLEQAGGNTPISASDSYAIIQVTLAHGGLKTSVQEALQIELANLEQQVNARYPDITIHRSGVFFFAADAASAAKQDIQLISAVSVIAVVTLLLLTFSSLRPLLLPFVSVGTGIAFAFVMTYWLYGSVHVLTIVFGASLIGIIIDYSLHYFYCHSNLAGDNTHSGLLNAMKLSLVSSVIGYGALGFSDLVSLQKVAVFSCAGLLAAWVTVLATANTLMGKRVTINPFFLPPIVRNLTRGTALVSKQPRLICGAISLAAILLIVIGVQGNDNPRVFFNPSAALLEEEKRVAEYASKIEPGRYFVVRANNEEALFNRIESLKEKFPQSALLTLTDWMPSPSEQRENHMLQKPLFQPGGAIDQFMSGLGLDAQPLLQEFADSEHTALSALSLFQNSELALPPLALKHDNEVFAFALVTDASKITSSAAHASNISGVSYIDIASLSSQALKDQRETATRFLVFAFLLVGLTLYFRYRDWRKLSMLFVPVAAVTGTMLLLGMFSGGMTLFHSMALFLVLGLGMDYVIFVSELKNETDMTLQAVFLSAVTSLLSFGLLSLSSIPVVHAFGITVLIGNSINLLGSFVYASVLQPATPAGGSR